MLVSFFLLLLVGTWRKVFENGANTFGSVHLRIANTQRYVVWYQGASVDTCRITCVASVER